MNCEKLDKSDYEEPCCPFTFPDAKVTVPVRRIIEKLDYYFEKKDFAAAQNHLIRWLVEARECGDINGYLTILNEQIGLYRKLSLKNECLEAAEKAMALASENGFENTVFFATTLINSATGYKAFSMSEKAIGLYRRAKELYERYLSESDERLGGLYNNMALALVDLKEFDEAEELYFKAIEIMKKIKYGEADAAITYLNLADLESARSGIEKAEKKIEEYLLKAENLLNSESLPRNGYYAFVCEKCEGVFEYYGFFLFSQELRKRAEEIYERN